ncbi:tetratricopeptide repeat protein [Sphingomicrobium sediminis]|uniref:Tetratricopeptide repeat protein n=1 Tax=Sphingomicrobium sediminis TaxID=2950949 RepID=A0A9X2EJX5_9SPHN|nr:hypothetical protein [Sphingomicrobium sediminis]MCM8556652.1 hypothetical protein [Sphingomicrobium sediminis]
MTEISNSAMWIYRLVAVMIILAAILHFANREPDATTTLLAHEFNASDEDYASATSMVEQSVEDASKRSDGLPESWLAQEFEAMALHRRAQLTGSFDDIRAADKILADARAKAPQGSGPLLTSAMVAFSAHRNPEAQTHLDAANSVAVRPRRLDRAEAAGLQGDLALYRGEYAEARSQYDRAHELAPGPSIALRSANLEQRLGNFDGGLRILAQSVAQFPDMSPRLGAVLLLSAGGMELKRGDWENARALFEKAEQVFPGYWLALAHIAQLDAAEGDLENATRRYGKILAANNEPSVMQAYAAMLEANGQAEMAARLNGKAHEILEARANLSPEAYADHMLDAAIGNGDVEQALKFARINHQARPYGDAKVGMARAYNLAGRYADAIDTLREVEESGWRSTEQYLALAESCEALGIQSCARKAKRQAQNFNSMAFNSGSGLLAFGNH